jgi:integrative and conjugative element protein (TIGR02256 family)
MPDKKRKVVRLSNSAYIAMLIETIKWMPKETGGILMGNRKSVDEWIITQVIGPGRNAKHTLTSFIPDYDYQEEEVAKIYSESNCLETYLGDWHTHPNSNSHLSKKDTKTLRRIALFKKARIENPLMLIIGTRPFELKTWAYLGKGLFGDLIHNSNIFFY